MPAGAGSGAGMAPMGGMYAQMNGFRPPGAPQQMGGGGNGLGPSNLGPSGPPMGLGQFRPGMTAPPQQYPPGTFSQMGTAPAMGMGGQQAAQGKPAQGGQQPGSMNPYALATPQQYTPMRPSPYPPANAPNPNLGQTFNYGAGVDPIAALVARAAANPAGGGQQPAQPQFSQRPTFKL